MELTLELSVERGLGSIVRVDAEHDLIEIDRFVKRVEVWRNHGRHSWERMDASTTGDVRRRF